VDTRLINAILSKDRKDTTYKYALLRGLVHCITMQSSHRKREGNGWFSYPLGILIFDWLFFYYPIFSSDVFIPQRNGETSDLQLRNTIAFRREFNEVIRFYRNKGGADAFRFDLLMGSIPVEIFESVNELLKKIQFTITDKPMRHLGNYQFGGHYTLVRKPESGRIRELSYSGLLKSCGRFEVNPDLHKVINDLGSLIIGEDSILNGWAEFTVKAAERSSEDIDISKEQVLEVLSKSTVMKRNTYQIRKLFEKEYEGKVYCVWTGSRVKKFHIDHTIPYSLWQNNGLWNLIPVKSSINLTKSDKIPSPELIDASAERIMEVWDLYHNRFGRQFINEYYVGLGKSSEEGFIEGIESLKAKSDYLINKRGFQVFEG
jgi:hypothetical protein